MAFIYRCARPARLLVGTPHTTGIASAFASDRVCVQESRPPTPADRSRQPMAAIMAPPPPALKYEACHNPHQGLVSESALRIIVETKACFVALALALALALAYFLTASQHRLWSSSHLIKGFLFAVTQPVTRFLLGMFTMLLSMPFRNDLYLLWGILLLAGYEGVYTISGYGVSARRSDLAVHEFARAYNIVTLGLYVRYYSSASQFRCPLWVLWALMVAKFLERIVRFKVANGRYGDASTSFVADYMKHEHKIEKTSSESTGDQDLCLKNCNYLIVGDSEAKAERVERQYEAQYKPAEDTVTIAKVWGCDGKLLKSKTHGKELRDVCLSFALCKLLRRKFAGVATAESERSKAQLLVFDDLISSGRGRTFRVVRTELGFARDLLYTKYPILFSSGFPVVSTALFVVTVGVSVWITVSANVDLLITFVIVGMVTGMEICEFFIHLFSDWTKVMVVTEYVRKPWLRNFPFLNSVLKFICCGKIAEPIGSSLGQFDLLKAPKKGKRLPECIVNLYHTARSFVLLTGDEDFRINKCKTLRAVPVDIEEMICSTLANNKDGLVRGDESLKRRTELEGDVLLARHCKAQTHIERIMVWHVATSTLELKDGGRQPRVGGSNKRLLDLEDGRRSRKGSGSSRVDYRLVATTLSKYCAYLVFYKPKLLPVASNSVRYMCNVLLDEAKAIGGKEAANAGRGGEEAAANGKEGPTHDSQEEVSIVLRGRKLASGLESVLAHGGGDGDGDEGLWEALAELWCELIVSMAPHGSIVAHQKELGKGGEFITHLWALLYHASIDDKFSGSSAVAAAAADAPLAETTTTSGTVPASSA
ncbi:unnamed protein product [Miscanthus lutarioriparius]|uniref:DUF4220 domain-containing protein n=1 Tax=Miscanthus lutarioriparius TaxID=422564 RepID=A0A811MAW3_9POAL|nr:unnamed protein product [Miscanthus lutarioriparius]